MPRPKAAIMAQITKRLDRMSEQLQQHKKRTLSFTQDTATGQYIGQDGKQYSPEQIKALESEYNLMIVNWQANDNFEGWPHIALDWPE